ncbi:UNVERIFIED_CONTAM: hypothetical protein Sindi_0812100 [Sesamum indicum]
MATILRNSCIYMCVCLLFSCLNDTADCLNSTSGHGWRIDDEAEFLMGGSEISRRVLGGKPPVVSYESMKQNKRYCDAEVYSSCFPTTNKLYKRPCDFKNLCDRDA